jgi:hypothetical protein
MPSSPEEEGVDMRIIIEIDGAEAAVTREQPQTAAAATVQIPGAHTVPMVAPAVGTQNAGRRQLG